MRTSNLQVPRDMTQVTGQETQIPYIPESIIPISGAWDVLNTGDALTKAGIQVKLKKDRSFPRSDEDKLIIKANGEVVDTLNLTGGNVSANYSNDGAYIRSGEYDPRQAGDQGLTRLEFAFSLKADGLWDAHTDNWWVLEMKMIDLYTNEEARSSNTVPVIESTYEVRNFFRLIDSAYS